MCLTRETIVARGVLGYVKIRIKNKTIYLKEVSLSASTSPSKPWFLNSDAVTPGWQSWHNSTWWMKNNATKEAVRAYVRTETMTLIVCCSWWCTTLLSETHLLRPCPYEKWYRVEHHPQLWRHQGSQLPSTHPPVTPTRLVAVRLIWHHFLLIVLIIRFHFRENVSDTFVSSACNGS